MTEHDPHRRAADAADGAPDGVPTTAADAPDGVPSTAAGVGGAHPPGTDARATAADAPEGRRAGTGTDADARTEPAAGTTSGAAHGTTTTDADARTDPAAEPGAGVRQLVGENFSLAESIGGVRGVIESILPGAMFVVVFVAVRDLTPALVASLAVALVLVVARLLARTPITQALGGLFGVGIGVVWAWRSGQAQDYFVFGLWTNAAYAAALLVSVLVRWPVVGVVVALLRQEGMDWRQDPAQRARRRRYTAATWLWIAMFVARLAVQLPLYLSAEVAWLGTARLVMGVPLWALTLWATWILVREPASAAEPERPPHPPR